MVYSAFLNANITACNFQGSQDLWPKLGTMDFGMFTPIVYSDMLGQRWELRFFLYGCLLDGKKIISNQLET